MLYNMLITHQGRVDRAPTTADDIVAIVIEPVVYMPKNCRNPLREAKQQRDLLKDHCNHSGALAGQRAFI